MRLWTLHPKYLDPQGLVALWREALLAQAVLLGRTKGYTRHPQLIRFSKTARPADTIATYLRAIHTEACRRGYRFDAAKIPSHSSVAQIAATEGQLQFEWHHLKTKLLSRSAEKAAETDWSAKPAPHPLFVIIPGPVSDWENIRR